MMKKIFLAALVISSAMISCKKDSDPVCEKSVGGIAGSYKLTKEELVVSGTPSPITLTPCVQGAIIRLNADKTVTYTESGSSCTDSFTGVWDVVNNKISISETTSGGSVVVYDNAAIDSWNCTDLVVSEDVNISGTSGKYVTTFTKQ
ncbi:MAG TPA: lipocalin family protein [Ferruginibacter sp.]|nr:lipocalin family protein [Ferruginibacter sp.]